jgi:hypothetical protein
MTGQIDPKTLLETMMFVVKRIEASGEGKAWVGTGYAYNVPKEGDTVFPVIITNRHVVVGAERIRILFHTTRDGKLDGGHVFLEIDRTNGTAILHPDPKIDLAAIVIGAAMNVWTADSAGRDLHWCGIASKDFWPLGDWEKLDACEPVMMIGCPSGLWDEKNGFPLFRRGVTATHAAIDFQGRPEFVVDIGVYSGSSGSPVFLWDHGLVKFDKTKNSFSPGGRFGLLGTLWGGPRITEKGEIVVEPAPTDTKLGIETGVRMHLGYVIKAKELVPLEELVQANCK